MTRQCRRRRLHSSSFAASSEIVTNAFMIILIWTIDIDVAKQRFVVAAPKVPMWEFLVNCLQFRGLDIFLSAPTLSAKNLGRNEVFASTCFSREFRQWAKRFLKYRKFMFRKLSYERKLYVIFRENLITMCAHYFTWKDTITCALVLR